MFNQTVLAGRLGRDPEIRTTTGGKKVATLSLCTSSYSKGKEYSEWHRVTAWGDGLVGLLEKHVRKGDLILVTGQNRTRKYTKDGVDHSATEVVMGPNDQVKFLDVKGKAKGDGHPPAVEADEEIPY